MLLCKKFISFQGCSVSSISLQSEGRPLHHLSQLSQCHSFVATLRLVGGKGGFGSMLRAIGMLNLSCCYFCSVKKF